MPGACSHLASVSPRPAIRRWKRFLTHHGAREHVPVQPRGKRIAVWSLNSDYSYLSSGRREALIAALTAPVFLSAAFDLQPAKAAESQLAEFTPPVANADPLTPMEQAIIEVFESNTYSVVNIVDATIQGPQRLALAEQPEGNGTGFVWDQDGHIVTNFHVLAGALQSLGGTKPNGSQKVAQVTLLGMGGVSQTLPGYLIGADRSRDLAVLKVNASKERLKPVSLVTSSQLRVGQQVLCIGNPFGFDHTLTTGVISGVGRDIQSRAGTIIGGGIQTDAAINPGNSGGPLLNSKGKLIGVNTAIFTQSGTSAGVGFAIPSDAVARAVPQLIQYGKIIRPSLHVQVASEQVSSALQIGRGALVQSVEPNSNAAKAGLQGTRRTITGIVPGDIIIECEGQAIKSNGDLLGVLEQFSIGDSIRLKVRREYSKEMVINLVLQEESS